MTLYIYFSLLLLIVVISYWVTFFLAIGHVWLYCAIFCSGLVGAKVLLPYTFTLSLLILVWWNLYSNYYVLGLMYYTIGCFWWLFG